MAKPFSKKADLSINIVIIAALGLAVLVVLFAVFTGRISVFGKGVDQTQNQLTTCAQQCQVSGYASGGVQDSCNDNPPQNRIYGKFSDSGFTSNPNAVCCCNRA